MQQKYPGALRASRILLRILIGLNMVAGVFILGLLIATLVSPGFVFPALLGGGKAVDPAMIAGGRMIMVLGLVAVPLTHVVLSRLLAIVETVRDGDPFVAENAVRLQTIAWTSLALEVIHLMIGAVASHVSTPETPLDINGDVSPTRWLAIVLIFVLARVFEHGTRMREDLEGTV
jgi:hypothetical protein